MITISDSEDELPTWGPKAPQKRKTPGSAAIPRKKELKANLTNLTNLKEPEISTIESEGTQEEGERKRSKRRSRKPQSETPNSLNSFDSSMPNQAWTCGLPCQICDKLISPREFLAHSRQHTLIPCELCSEMLDPSDFLEHMNHHEKTKQDKQAPPSPELMPCEVCGDLFMLSEYLQHLQEHDLAIAKAKTKDLPECETPVLMAARWVEQLRCDADTQNLLSSCIVNFDLAVSFAERALREKSRLVPRLAGPWVVYHWTPSKNFKNIIYTNLQVPDQKHILNQTDDGFYGAGIYTSPSFLSFEDYAHGRGGCFLCLGLPGRQYRANEHQDRGRPCRPNYETHTSPNREEWVFFASDQLLPCFLIDRATQPRALHTVQLLEASIRKDLGLPQMHPDP